MRKVRLSTGLVSQTPYYISNLGMNIYSIEELCYLFALNPFMIDQEIMNMSLIDFIEKDCALQELAAQLKGAMNRECRLEEFVDIIITYVNYNSEEDRGLIFDTLKQNSGLSDFERRISQADHLRKNKRLEAALMEYEKLLNSVSQNDIQSRCRIFDSIGMVYIELFMFEVASKFFKRSYNLGKNRSSGIKYIACLRVVYPEDKYISFIADNPEFTEMSEELESKAARALSDFEASSENIMLSALSIYKDEGNLQSYYEEIDAIITGLKEDYLKMVTIQ